MRPAPNFKCECGETNDKSYHGHWYDLNGRGEHGNWISTCCKSHVWKGKFYTNDEWEVWINSED